MAGNDNAFLMPLVQPFSKVKDLRDYFEFHLQNGRGDAVVKGRMMAIVIPPIGNDSHDMERGEVFLNLIPE